MQKITSFLLLLTVSTFSGCHNQAGIPATQPDISSPSPIINSQSTSTPTSALDKQDNSSDSNSKAVYLYFDASKEWDANEYEKIHGQKLNYFNAPILSPYKYTYHCESKDITIDEVALAIGTIMMDDFMKDYEGKTFTVTEYQNLTAHVMDETELDEWENHYRETGKNVILKENQWLCTFDCEYKYTGEYGNIGEMPADLEWKKGLDTDGSGEAYVFIIQKVSEVEYIMRALPKTMLE